MHRSQFTEKDKQIEYINQYYDQLHQEKLTNKKTIEEAIRRQNFDCDQIQNMKSLNVPCQREIEPTPSRIPIRHHEQDSYPAPAYPRFEPQAQNPAYLPMNQPMKYSNPASHYPEIDRRYLECPEIPQNYYEKSPIELHHEMRPNFNRFPQGDHRYVYNTPSIPQGHFVADQCPPPRPLMYCGDQNTSNFNQNAPCRDQNTSNFNQNFVQNAPCTCQCNTKIPIRVIPTLKNRTDELPVRDLRNQWLDTYNAARMERKNNIIKNR